MDRADLHDGFVMSVCANGHQFNFQTVMQRPAQILNSGNNMSGSFQKTSVEKKKIVYT